MKYFLLFGIAILTFASQTLRGQELTMRQIGDNYVFAQDNQILTIRETIDLLPPGSESRRLLRGSRFYTVSGNVFAAMGGGLLGFALGEAIFDNYADEEGELWLIAGAGAVLAGGGILLASVGDRRVRRAVAQYNGYPAATLRLRSTGNSIGLCLTF